MKDKRIGQTLILCGCVLGCMGVAPPWLTLCFAIGGLGLM